VISVVDGGGADLGHVVTGIAQVQLVDVDGCCSAERRIQLKLKMLSN